MNDKLRILIVDDQTLFLDGLRTLFALKYPSIEIVDAVVSGEDALRIARSRHIDVVLLDMKMPDMDGVETARRLLNLYPRMKIIMLTTFDERNMINDALKAGVAGYILKDVPLDELVNIIQSVHKGNIIVSPPVARKLVSGNIDDNDLDSDSRINLITRLTKTQRTILFHMSLGKTNSAIAEEIHLSEKTIRNYITAMYDVLGVSNRTQAVLWAVNNNIRPK